MDSSNLRQVRRMTLKTKSLVDTNVVVGLTVKKRNFKGCLPKGNAALSRSIIAIVCVDVGIVTTMNLIGALIPISGTMKHWPC